VQAPDFSQSFNRYSYAWNNPLIFADPTGELVWLASALFVVGSGLIKAAFRGQTSQGWSWSEAGKGFAQGAAMAGTMVGGFYLPGAVGGLASAWNLGGFSAGLLYGGSAFASSAISSGVMSWGTTGSFNVNWNAAGISGGIAGLMGGIGAHIEKRNPSWMRNPYNRFASTDPVFFGGTIPEVVVTADRLQNATRQIGNWAFVGGGILGSAGAFAQESNATFRMTNSRGMYDPRWYSGGWTGNQHVIPYRVASVGRGVSRAGTVAGAASFGIDTYQTYHGNMSIPRWGYRGLSFGTSTYVGLTMGGPAGMLVGASFYGYEMIFDHMIRPMHEFFRNMSDFWGNSENVHHLLRLR